MMEKIKDMSVLIAEDEAGLLSTSVEYLEIFFEKVYAAKDGLSAFRLYEKHKPEIIITDINMPHLDGLSMVSKIREKDDKTQIIICSAHSQKEKLMKAVELHLVKYLIKPVQSDLLRELLLSVVADLRQKSERVYLKEGYYWDKNRKLLFSQAQEVILKEKEKKVLDLLCSRARQSVCSMDIYNHLYADEIERDFSSDAITSLIKRLRPKLPQGSIVTVYGVGYVLYTDE